MKKIIFLVFYLISISVSGVRADTQTSFAAVTQTSYAAATETVSSATQTAKAVLRGKITVLGSREPAVDAVIEAAMNSETVKAHSAKDGSYRLELGPGTWTIVFSAEGLETIKRVAELAAGQDAELNISPDRIDFVSDAIVVSAKKDKTEVIKTSITREEIKKIPGTAGDALRAIQTLPGVAMTGDYSSGLAVQGGGPGDNLYLLDNMPWPYPFHFGGILSTVYSGLISSVDLYSAGFGVQWGNTYGAVLDVKTRPADKEMFRLDADINLITAQGLLESPLGLSDASIAIYGRRSYIDLLFGALLRRNGFTIKPFFWDAGGSLDFTLGKENHFKAIILDTDDILDVTADPTADTTGAFSNGLSSDNGAVSGGISWINTAIEGLKSQVTFYYYNLIQKEDAEPDIIDIGQSDLGIKWECTWEGGRLLGLSHTPGFGVDVENVHDKASVFLEHDIVHHTANSVTLSLDGSHINRGGYLQDSIQLIKGLDVTAGMRYDKDDNVGHDTLFPRVSIAWQSDPDTLWKAAWGIYSQFPDDIQLNPTFGNPNLTPSYAQHSVAGVERKITAEISARVDAYYKYYTDLVANTNTARIYENSGLGMAKGVEFFLDAKFGGKFFGWISYAFSRSERLSASYGKWILYRYDQPNLLTAVASYNITPAWSAGFKLHYNTGPLEKKFISASQDVNGDWHPVFSDDYVKRLDDYLRLDIRTDYAFRYENWKLNLYLEIINLLNRSNPMSIAYARDYSSSQVVYNLPLMPYIGVEAEF